MTGTAQQTHARFFRITADDFGWTLAHNQAVERAVKAGVLTHASLLSGGLAAREAAQLSRTLPQLGVGVHLQLHEGQPLTSSLSGTALVQPSGAFCDGFSPLVQTFFRGKLPLSAIELEWRAQIERALGFGLSLSHLDGHKHVHVLPPLADLTCRLAIAYRIPYVRTPLETPSAQAAKRLFGYVPLSGLAWAARRTVVRFGLDTADHFVGFSRSGQMTLAALLSAVQTARPGVTEIMVHPAEETSDLAPLLSRYAFAKHYRFARELSALLSPQFASALSHAASL